MPRHGDGDDSAAEQPEPGPEPEPEPSDADAQRSSSDADVWSAMAASLPEDVQQSLAELREPGGCARVGRWLLVAALYAGLGAALWLAMLELYFGSAETCQSAAWDRENDEVETLIGALPIALRNALLLALGWQVCRRLTGFHDREQGRPGLAQALLVGGHGAGDGQARDAGWTAIVGSGGGALGAASQPTWEEAREARGLTVRQAISSAVVKLVLWHCSQPVVYLSMLFLYRCYVASLGEWQMYFASIVAAREVLYLGSTLLAAWQCPVFLLMDPITAWKEASGWLERLMRGAMYVLTPHNYVALCLANRFRGWERLFLGLAGIQVVADLASCFALGALLAGGIEKAANSTVIESPEEETPAALVIGYVLTASGFLLFFGPLSVVSSLRGAADRNKHTCTRLGFGASGVSLLSSLLYILVLYGLLFEGTFNPFCDDFTFRSNPCHSNGQCYGAGQCRCELGFGPELSYSGEPLCARDGMPCTKSQLERAPTGGGEVCCSHHGTVAAGACECEPGLGPEVPDNDVTPEVLLCSWQTVCTAAQLQRAKDSDDEAACGGAHFPGSRLLTPEWGTTLNGWVTEEWGNELSGWTHAQHWRRCCSTFEGCDTGAKFHAACDSHNTTLTVAHNAGDGGSNPGNFTFGGFVRIPSARLRAATLVLRFGPHLCPIFCPFFAAWFLAVGSVLGLVGPPRRDGENAQKTGKNGQRMGEIRPNQSTV
eukprot:COSAG04_NODE_3319_length_2939_cov_23.714085_1_plen_716_part_00